MNKDIRIYWEKINEELSLYRVIIIIPNNGKNYKIGDKFIVEEYTPNKYKIISTDILETKAYRYLEIIDIDDNYFYILTYSDLLSDSDMLKDDKINNIKNYITNNLL